MSAGENTREGAPPEPSPGSSSREASDNQRKAWHINKLLAHPMTLLIVTAIVSGLLIPQLTQQWQTHQQQLDTRREFAARISRTVGEIFIATQLAQVQAASQSQEEFDTAYVRWEVESAVLDAELRAFYRSDSLDQAWSRCRQLTTAYYAQSGMTPGRRISFLKQLQSNLNLPAYVDLTNIEVLRAEVMSERDKVIRKVLDDPIE
jgi:hypothetical protein